MYRRDVPQCSSNEQERRIAKLQIEAGDSMLIAMRFEQSLADSLDLSQSRDCELRVLLFMFVLTVVVARRDVSISVS